MLHMANMLFPLERSSWRILEGMIQASEYLRGEEEMQVAKGRTLARSGLTDVYANEMHAATASHPFPQPRQAVQVQTMPERKWPQAEVVSQQACLWTGTRVPGCDHPLRWQGASHRARTRWLAWDEAVPPPDDEEYPGNAGQNRWVLVANTALHSATDESPHHHLQEPADQRRTMPPLVAMGRFRKSSHGLPARSLLSTSGSLPLVRRSPQDRPGSRGPG